MFSPKILAPSKYPPPLDLKEHLCQTHCALNNSSKSWTSITFTTVKRFKREQVTGPTLTTTDSTFSHHQLPFHSPCAIYILSHTHLSYSPNKHIYFSSYLCITELSMISQCPLKHKRGGEKMRSKTWYYVGKVLPLSVKSSWHSVWNSCEQARHKIPSSSVIQDRLHQPSVSPWASAHCLYHSLFICSWHLKPSFKAEISLALLIPCLPCMTLGSTSKKSFEYILWGWPHTLQANKGHLI